MSTNGSTAMEGAALACTGGHPAAVVGGAIPSQFIPAVETGVRQVMEAGAIAGYPMQDIGVTVYDGKHHSVDSKEVAFVQAGRKAFLDAISKAAPIVLEPIVDVSVAVPSHSVGGATGDLSAMRGMVNGTVLPDNRMEVSGQAPLKEIQGYHSRLKSLTGGEGSFTMDFSHYAQVPEQTQQEWPARFVKIPRLEGTGSRDRRDPGRAEARRVP